MKRPLGFNNGDFRFFKTPQSNIYSTNWDEVRHFNSVEEALDYWEHSSYLEMYQVTEVGNQIHIIPYEY